MTDLLEVTLADKVTVVQTGTMGPQGPTGPAGSVDSVTGTEPITVGGTAADPVVGLTATSAARAIRNSGGNLILNSTSWADLDVNLDLTLTAKAGDWIEFGISGTSLAEAVGAQLDVATIVAAAVTNYISNGTGTPPGNGIVGWALTNGGSELLSGSVPYQLQAGDIDNGQVKLRMRYSTDSAANKTILSSSTTPFMVWAINHR